MPKSPKAVNGKRFRDRRYRNNRSNTPQKRLWFRTVPFNEEEHYAFIFKCKLEGVKYPARKLRELALEWAGYEDQKKAQD